MRRHMVSVFLFIFQIFKCQIKRLPLMPSLLYHPSSIQIQSLKFRKYIDLFPITCMRWGLSTCDAVPTEAKRGHQIPQSWSYRRCGCWELNSGALCVKQVLLTSESPFQPKVMTSKRDPKIFVGIKAPGQGEHLASHRCDVVSCKHRERRL